MENEPMNPKTKNIIRGVSGLLLVIILFSLRPCTIISAGQRGVILNWGAVSQNIMQEGIHFRMPIKQDIVKMDVQTQKHLLDTDAYSKDIQPVKASLALNFHVKADLANKLYQEVGRDYVGRIVDPSIQESVKAAMAKYTAQELIEQRHKVKQDIKDELAVRLEQYIQVDEFSITNFTFSDEYEKAVESKQVAQQSALKAENDLNRIKTEAAQRVAQATAEAEAIKIQAQAVTQQGGKDYVQMKAIEKWNGVLPIQMIPGGTVPFINLREDK